MWQRPSNRSQRRLESAARQVFTSVGGKPRLLKSALDVAIVGDDEPIALPERPRSVAIRAEPDPRRYVTLYAELVTEMGGRLAGIYEAGSRRRWS